MHVYKGTYVDKLIGKGVVAVISDETVAAIGPVYINGHSEPVVQLMLSDAMSPLGEYGDTSTEPLRKTILRKFRNGMSGQSGYLTMPMLGRGNGKVHEAWEHAADVLEALANEARIRAKELMVNQTGVGGKIIRKSATTKG